MDREEGNVLVLVKEVLYRGSGIVVAEVVVVAAVVAGAVVVAVVIAAGLESVVSVGALVVVVVNEPGLVEATEEVAKELGLKADVLVVVDGLNVDNDAVVVAVTAVGDVTVEERGDVAELFEVAVETGTEKNELLAGSVAAFVVAAAVVAAAGVAFVVRLAVVTGKAVVIVAAVSLLAADTDTAGSGFGRLAGFSVGSLFVVSDNLLLKTRGLLGGVGFFANERLLLAVTDERFVPGRVYENEALCENVGLVSMAVFGISELVSSSLSSVSGASLDTGLTSAGPKDLVDDRVPR